MYSQHRDFNGEIVQEGINRLYQREVRLASPLTEEVITIPSPNIYGIVFLKIPTNVTVKVKINDFDYISIYAEGSQFSPIVNGISSLSITTDGTSDESIELLFIE